MYVLFFAERVQKTRSSCACYQQNKQEGCEILEKEKVLLIFICFADLLYDSVNHMLAFPYLGKKYPGPSISGLGSGRI